jgi:signal transduction histidine kinase
LRAIRLARRSRETRRIFHRERSSTPKPQSAARIALHADRRIQVQAAIEDSVAEISVTGAGVGIPAAEQEPVFDRFYQAGSKGLAIARQMVEAHGGRIWLRSEPDKGSRFAFTMPLDTRVEEVQ